MSVYLDYNASTPIDPRVLDVMIEVYRNEPGNADSRTHDYGGQTRKVTENARKQVAELLGVTPEEVFYTSGSTESNNIAIQGLRDYAALTGKKHIITTSIEHKSVLNTVRYMESQGFEVDYVSPDISGRVSAEDVLKRVREDTLLVSIMHVNNETGTIQPVNKIGETLAEKDVLFHVDATQSCGKLVEQIRNLHYDMLSLSAHKFRGPQGIGALILKRRNYKLPPVKNIYFGGQQEHGLRPGTIPVALVAGMGKACELAQNEYKKEAKDNQIIKNEMLNLLNSEGVRYELNGDPQYCIDSTLNICFEGVSSEALMLSAKQYCAISNGSACTSKSYDPSYVLKAMDIPIDKIESSVRISWGSGTNHNEIIDNFKKMLKIVKDLVA